MPNMNRVILAGHLGADPELKYTEGGGALLRMRLATSEKWKDKATGEKKERTEWHTVVMWGARAEALNNHLAKGQAVLIEGKLQYRQWEDKDGNKRTTAEVLASNLEFCGGGGGRRNREESEPRGTPQGYNSGDDYGADDIPF